MASNLLQDVLRYTAHERIDTLVNDKDDSDDELVNVFSLPGTPARSRPPTRPTSPSRGTPGRLIRGPLLTTSIKQSTDPLKVFSFEICQRIFSLLGIRDLARCARVSLRWRKSQTLNYVWFQHYRKENFYDTSLPQGKWTKRESKQNWLSMYTQVMANRSPPFEIGRSRSGYTSPPTSGYQTPREIREERWRLEAEVVEKPGKTEMREMYKELNGRKSKAKGKLGGVVGIRDKGGWAESLDEGWN
ncbi:hypothetical protein B0F90DRAFT_1673082 [Multifurca ochricompacta]|uniref:F-box domain-containing protein n=1 Tax=Multifurca ochricompacta TaxID=376703 RepID=A0AAD4MBN5_9AGAM|nr:hypothetical protein B0F90DRAFT_1673082 [Multifurca ochricompacta]